MIRRLVSFRTRHQPFMVRASYRHELRSALTYPLAASLAEGAFTGVVAAKYFNATQLLIAVITAAPMFGNIAALVWSDLARGRRKVPFVNMLQAGVVLSIGACALTVLLPPPIDGWIFAFLIIAARMLASGIVTIRSGIWRVNYPKHLRGQIIARISIVATAVLTLTTLLAANWLDKNPKAFVYLYPGAAVLGVVGIWQFSRIRVRREGQLLRREQLYTPRPESLAQTDETNVMNYQPNGHRRPGLFGFFAEARRVLKEDAQFRNYQRWQFISGFSFMMYGPSLLYMVSREMTDPAKDYLLATIIVQIIPLVVSLVATQLWAPLFDAVHITVFRVYQTCTSVMGQLLLYAGAMVGLHPDHISLGLWIIALGQVFIGISNGGGNLAWNLGHNDFAPPEKSATYMGVHVMLTGLRGCFAPFLGVALYKVPGVGRNVFGLAVIICFVALVGFWSMARRAPRKARVAVTMGTPEAAGASR